MAEIKGKKILSIEEKPKKPKSNYALTGLYLFDNKVFSIIKTLKPSKRNQLEITEVINSYLKSNSLSYKFVKGFWSDAGTFESLHKAASFMQKKREKT